MKKLKRNVILSVEGNRLYLSNQTSDSMSAKVEVTPLYHFFKEYFDSTINNDEQYKCQSYCDDNGKIINCSCRKCELEKD